ncbi:TonB-dependent receptor domain-containing protein [Agaribacterium haliotis]|uniref:TonB-dependent receptor domain-containing protein n=1 Tax=Agaribacterium haliotis TaxID=2013869 RepID=UPI00195DAC80|nr:TonB-dependent receptor [Agaribacterium haliotis]
MFKPSLLALAVIAASSSYAEENKDVETLEVWGTSVRASSVYMSQEDIEIRQADHISDLLRVIPGVDVGGAHSLNQRITIRSMDDKDINITIDGASQNNYMYHHMGNLQIHADILQAVDIDVGTNSVLYGGLGGAVRFETKSAEQLLGSNKDFGARVKGTVSDNGSDDVSLSAYGNLSSTFDVLAYYNRIEKKDYQVGGGEIKDDNGQLVPGTDGKVRGLAGTVDSALIKAGWNIADNQRLKLGYEYYKDEGEYSYRPDMGLATDISIAEGTNTPLIWPTEYDRDTVTLNYDAQFGNTDISATFYDNDSTLWRDERGYAQSTIPRFQAFAAIVQGEAGNHGLNVMANSELATQKFSFGFEYVNYDTNYQANYISGDVVQSSEDSRNMSLFVQDRINLGRVFSLTPGVRYDKVKVNSVVVDKEFTETSFALAAEAQASDSLVFRLSSTELFQAPELAEVFIGAGLGDEANPGIEAETGLNTEFAVAYGSSIRGDDQFTAGLTLFQTSIDNYIYDYTQKGKDNIGDMQIQGYEAYVGYVFANWDLLLTYASSDSDLDAFEQYKELDGARLDRSQGDSLSFKLGYDLSSAKLKFFWETLVVADLDAVDVNKQLDGAGVNNGKEGYQVHNVSANWQPLQALSLTFGIDNLFDEYYVSQSSRTGSSDHPVFGPLPLNDYEPGRNIKATVAYQF